MSTGSSRRYVPKTEGLNREFFIRAAGGTIHLQRCDQCSGYRFPPRRYCSHCFSGDWHWEPSAGTGTVSSWVTSWFTLDRGWVADLPDTTIVVQTDEGPRLLGAMRSMTTQELSLGKRVVMVPETVRDDFVFFWVEPA